MNKIQTRFSKSDFFSRILSVSSEDSGSISSVKVVGSAEVVGCSSDVVGSSVVVCIFSVKLSVLTWPPTKHAPLIKMNTQNRIIVPRTKYLSSATNNQKLTDWIACQSWHLYLWSVKKSVHSAQKKRNDPIYDVFKNDENINCLWMNFIEK